MTTATRTRLRNIAEIHSFFRTNEQPIYFVGPTGFNLLGLESDRYDPILDAPEE